MQCHNQCWTCLPLEHLGWDKLGNPAAKGGEIKFIRPWCGLFMVGAIPDALHIYPMTNEQMLLGEHAKINTRIYNKESFVFQSEEEAVRFYLRDNIRSSLKSLRKLKHVTSKEHLLEQIHATLAELEEIEYGISHIKSHS